MFEIRKAVLENGKCPFDEWRAALVPLTRGRVDRAVARLGVGVFSNCRSISGVAGLFELRIDFGPGIRVYYGREGAAVILLLCGGDKSTQGADIAKASRMWREYREGVKNGNKGLP